jgi:hypothetical protein
MMHFEINEEGWSVTEPPKNEGFVALGSIGGFSIKRECTNTSHKQKIPYIKFKYNYYTLVSCIRVTKG